MSALEYLKHYAYYYLYAITITLVLSFLVSAGATEVSGELELPSSPVLIIDAGHGGMDGGTTSCTGVLEKELNLQIAVRLNDLFRLLGYETRMTRTTQDSLATEGKSIREQKRSDLNQRVSIVNSAPGGILISIHQNYYPQSQYSGPQVFYTNEAGDFAAALQKGLNALTEGHDRACKKAEGIYLMDHITAPGVLIECGFLSNPAEEANLLRPEYQKKLCAVIAGSAAQYLESEMVG